VSEQFVHDLMEQLSERERDRNSGGRGRDRRRAGRQAAGASEPLDPTEVAAEPSSLSVRVCCCGFRTCAAYRSPMDARGLSSAALRAASAARRDASSNREDDDMEDELV
jgi:hypothetical protein